MIDARFVCRQSRARALVAENRHVVSWGEARRVERGPHAQGRQQRLRLRRNGVDARIKIVGAERWGERRRRSCINQRNGPPGLRQGQRSGKADQTAADDGGIVNNR